MRFIPFVILGLCAAAAGLAADVTGKWTAEMQTSNGTIQLTYQFKAEGAALTGTLSSEQGEMKIQEGKVNGDELTWVIVYERDGNALRILNKAAVSGSEMKIQSTIEGRDRSYEYTAKKAS